jgi:hypothetical protein
LHSDAAAGAAFFPDFLACAPPSKATTATDTNAAMKEIRRSEEVGISQTYTPAHGSAN